jgi:acetolactate synthase-1/2/3 large subunit
MSEGAAQTTVARALVEELYAAGVRRIYGIPGGGSNMAIVGAVKDVGIEFVLVHHEPAAMFAAAGESELSGVPGVCIATVGPGVASSMNGLAHCRLDQVPLVLITDRPDSEAFLHQKIDHARLVMEVVKHSERIDPSSPRAAVRRALGEAARAPAGPVHLDLSPSVAAAPAAPAEAAAAVPTPELEGDLVVAAALITQSRRPVILAGLGARTQGVPAAVRSFAERFGVPVLTTYKAKGVLAEDHIWAAGLVTNGALEGRVLDGADALVTVGFETVELMPGTWPWPRPTIAIGDCIQNDHIPHEVELRGGTAHWLEQLERVLVAAGWTSAWTTAAPPSAWLSQEDLVAEVDEGVSPVDVARIARELAPAGSIATVDAGSHMLAATQFWSAEEPLRFLISNGLATMGYALPAAIGASLASPGTIVVCFTGDGGLAMVTGELETAARTGARVVVLAFNDATLNLIKVKQEKRGEPTTGLDFNRIEWAAIARAMGVDAYEASSPAELRSSLTAAFEATGSALVDVRLNPSSYSVLLDTIRG